MEPLSFDELVSVLKKAVLNFALDSFLDISDEDARSLAVSLVKTLAMAGALEEGSNILRELQVRPHEFVDEDDQAIPLDEDFAFEREYALDLAD